MLSILISAIVQFLLAFGIVWLIYRIFGDKQKPFTEWAGLYLPESSEWVKPGVLIMLIAIILMALPIYIFKTAGLITNDMIYSSEFHGQGLSFTLLIIIFFKAVFQTAFAEELIFRGWIGKRIANKFGYLKGNISQSLLFGVPHGLPLMLMHNQIAFGVVIFITSSTVGFLQFYLNEKKAEGSIMPSIIIHSILNITSFTIQSVLVI